MNVADAGSQVRLAEMVADTVSGDGPCRGVPRRNGESYADSLGVDEIASLVSALELAARSATSEQFGVHDFAAAAAHERS